MRHSLTLAAALLLSTGAAIAAPAAPDAVSAAVADATRPAADREADARRLPEKTLRFAGVKKGDVVAEFLPGGAITRAC